MADPIHCNSCGAELNSDGVNHWCESCDVDREDEADDGFEFDCGMMPDGQCSKAGSEECDWDCPHN